MSACMSNVDPDPAADSAGLVLSWQPPPAEDLILDTFSSGTVDGQEKLKLRQRHKEKQLNRPCLPKHQEEEEEEEEEAPKQRSQPQRARALQPEPEPAARQSRPRTFPLSGVPAQPSSPLRSKRVPHKGAQPLSPRQTKKASSPSSPKPPKRQSGAPQAKTQPSSPVQNLPGSAVGDVSPGKHRNSPQRLERPSHTLTLSDASPENGMSSSYRVLYCEHFELDGESRINFCVRRFPANDCGSGTVTYELRVGFVVPATSNRSNSSITAPMLLWDFWSSMAFDWSPPPSRLFPQSGQQLGVDGENRCLVSRFIPQGPSSSGSWYLSFTWVSCAQEEKASVPCGINTQIILEDGRVLRHPNGKNFVVPIRGGFDVEGEAHAMAHDSGVLRDAQSALRRAQRELQHLKAQRQSLEGCIKQQQVIIEAAKDEAASRAPLEVVKGLEGRLAEETSHRRRLLGELLDLKGRLRVFCRIRGPVEEHPRGAPNVVQRNSATELFLPRTGANFNFDMVFGAEAQTNAIFSEICPMLDSILEEPGKNGAVIAYGQTGAGKTFTMEGEPQQPGIIGSTIAYAYEKMRILKAAGGSKVRIRVSMVEIYQDQVYDLLEPVVSGRSAPKCDLLQSGDSAAGCEIVVRGLRVLLPESSDQALELQRAGARLRRCGTSERNSRSSRSHTIFTLYIEDCESSKSGKLSLVDLAGSERQSAGCALDWDRVNEAKFINQSLTSLGKVVKACIRDNCKSPGRNSGHVPYRDSVLTRFLQDSVGGSAKTFLIVHVTPYERDLPESLCTLQFAERAGRVEQRLGQRSQSKEKDPKVDDAKFKLRVRDLQEENARLKAALASERSTEASVDYTSNAGRSPPEEAKENCDNNQCYRMHSSPNRMRSSPKAARKKHQGS